MKNKWHDDVFWGMHFDWHVQKDERNIGEKLSVEYLKEFYKALSPDWVQVDTKGHPGYCCWPTETGSYPAELKVDALALQRQATKELGIRLGSHYSGVWDSRAVELHPDWAQIDNQGRLSICGTCNLSDYTRDLMIPQLLELISKYGIDNIWVDGENWGSSPCWCKRCVTKFKQDTGYAAPKSPDEPHWREWMDFHRANFVEHVRIYTDAVHQSYPDVLICSNWMYSARQPQDIEVAVDYLSGDFDPAWGAARAATESRMLDCRKRDYKLSWDLMLWCFTKSFETIAPMSGVMKPVPHMCQEASEVLAQSGAIMLYDTAERSGIMAEWRRKYYYQVRDWCLERKPWCFETETASEAAVLQSAPHMEYFGEKRSITTLFDARESNQAMEGALHFLLESGISADILTESSLAKRLGNYKLLIVAESAALSEPAWSEIEKFIHSGGNVIFSGYSPCERVKRLLGVKTSHIAEQGKVCLPVDGEAVIMPNPWHFVEILDADTEILSKRLNGFCPVENRTEDIAAVIRRHYTGSCIGIFGKIFPEYYLGHYPIVRKLLNQYMDKLNISWSCRIADWASTPYVELILRRRGKDLLINLINRCCMESLAVNRGLVSEIPPVQNIKLILNRPGKTDSCMCRLENSNVTINGNSIILNKLDIHNVIEVKNHIT